MWNDTGRYGQFKAQSPALDTILRGAATQQEGLKYNGSGNAEYAGENSRFSAFFTAPRRFFTLKRRKTPSARWRALLYEGFHPGAPLFAREARRNHLRGELVGLVDAKIDLLVEGAFARGDGGRRFLADLQGELVRFRTERVRGHDPVHETPFESLARIDQIAGEQH